MPFKMVKKDSNNSNIDTILYVSNTNLENYSSVNTPSILDATLYERLNEYIEKNYVKNDSDSNIIDLSRYLLDGYDYVGFYNSYCVLREESDFPYSEEKHIELQERVKNLSDTFCEYLMNLINMKNLSPAEVYKGAIITKQVFSRIKLNPNYHPNKATALRLCIGAKLNLDEAKALLARAGYALSPCDKRDIIFSFFIENEIFDMIEIDLVLEEYGLSTFIA